MSRRVRQCLGAAVVGAIPVWSGIQLRYLVPLVGESSRWRHGRLSGVDVSFIVHCVVLFAWALFAYEVVRSLHMGGEKPSQIPFLRRSAAWLVASCALAPSGPVDRSHVERTTIPVGDLLSPSLASAAIMHILRIRREQAQDRSRSVPTSLHDEDLTTLWRVRRQASRHREHDVAIELTPQAFAVDPDVRRLLDSVKTVEDLDQQSRSSVVDEWTAVVRVYGYPCVESRHGIEAKFRKRRALELVTWLALNRDRSRRSAARNAMWDVPINDSTFSTIVSDMRRSLAELDGSIDHNSWCPTTFSDEILLNTRVTTDAQLLRNAIERFRRNSAPDAELEYELARLRDMPFAGTSYSWADLDGTTTRLIIQATEAAEEVAKWSLENDRPDLLQVATAAGLRVMPGNEELLRLQGKVLPATRGRRVVSVP